MAENTAGVVYTAEAADPEGEAVTYALSGTDAALFTIDAATGAVSFVTAPDFESPADADGDNNYEITVTASDGSLTTDQSVTITVTAVDEGPAVFSSGSTASVNENASGVVYTAAATEPGAIASLAPPPNAHSSLTARSARSATRASPTTSAHGRVPSSSSATSGPSRHRSPGGWRPNPR